MNKKKIEISLSILEANLLNLGSQISNILSDKISSIHLDIMDNHYVNNLTFGPNMLKSLRDFGICNDIHVHLMSYNINTLIKIFIKYGASSILIHPETSNHILESINIIKNNNCKVGIVINPTTSLNILKYIINYIDIILIMSVTPGFSNQKFIYESIDKIKNSKNIIDKFGNKNIILAVDGGINESNIKKIINAGANMLIIGSYIFKNINTYKKVIDNIF